MTSFSDTIVMEMLSDGRRLHLRNGPIDLIIEVCGTVGEVGAAYQQARDIFSTILTDLTDELDIMRTPIGNQHAKPMGQITKAMSHTTSRLSGGSFATPMICVAGAVADYVLHAMLQGRNLQRAYVNNGGDIALFLAPEQKFDVGICANPMTGVVASVAQIASTDGVGGIATSGWRGRSHSLGIADAVTVLASNAAMADAAATLIANAIDLPGHSNITRAPAHDLFPDSDLGGRFVTTDVTKLSAFDANTALDAGRILAQRMIDQSLILAAYGNLQGELFALNQKSINLKCSNVTQFDTLNQKVPAYA